MDAKSLQLTLVLMMAAAIGAIVLDVVAALRHRTAFEPLRWRTPGVALAACGFLAFASLAVVFSSPQAGWEAANPKDESYSWFFFFPAGLLAALTVQAAVRPSHAARVLLGIALLLTGLALAAAATVGQTSEGALPALAATLIFFCLPAAITGWLLVSSPASRPPAADSGGGVPAGRAR